MRTRARTTNATSLSGVSHYVRDDTGALIGGPYNYNGLSYESRNEIIKDQFMYKRQAGCCSHSSSVSLHGLAGQVQYTWGSNPVAKSTHVNGALFSVFVNTNAPTWLSPIMSLMTFSWGQASYDAMKQMRPAIDDGLLLPNFVAELAETGIRLGRDAKKRLQRIKDRLKNPSALNRLTDSLVARRVAASREDLSFLSRSVGDIARLARKVALVNIVYQFCVRPTVSDAKKLLDLVDQYRSVVSELIRKANTLQRRYYSRPVDGLALPAVVYYGTQFYHGRYARVERRVEWLTRPTYHANMLFTYDASALQGLLGKLDGLIHALGVSRVASVIWEAIPYSFIVDWFVDVGGMISSFEDQLLDPLPVLVHDFSHSLKYAYRTKLEWQYGDSPAFSMRRLELAWKDTRFYERRRDYPSLWDSLSVHSPNANQVGLGLSLIILKMDGIHGRSLSKKRSS